MGGNLNAINKQSIEMDAEFELKGQKSKDKELMRLF